MKLKLILLMLVAMMPCRQVAAQTPLALQVYDRETIYLYNSFFGGGFVKDGQIMPLGIFSSNLASEMSGSEYALEEMGKAHKYKIIGAASGLVVTAVQIASIAIYLWDRDYVSKPGFQIASIGIGGAAGIISVGYNRLAMGAMNRAVWLYNRDVMSGRLRYQTEGMQQ